MTIGSLPFWSREGRLDVPTKIAGQGGDVPD